MLPLIVAQNTCLVNIILLVAEVIPDNWRCFSFSHQIFGLPTLQALQCDYCTHVHRDDDAQTIYIVQLYLQGELFVEYWPLWKHFTCSCGAGGLVECGCSLRADWQALHLFFVLLVFIYVCSTLLSVLGYPERRYINWIYYYYDYYSYIILFS